MAKQNSQKSLINAYLLDGKGGGNKLSWEQVDAWTPEQGILWLHLDYTAPRAKKWIKRSSGLEQLVANALLVEEARPRSVVTSKGLLVFLRGINLSPGQDPEDMVLVRVWLDENRIITTRKRKLLSTSEIAHAIDTGVGPKTSAEFLLMLNTRLLSHMSDVIESIDEQVDDLEEQIVTAQSYLLRPKISEVRRQSTLIRKYLAPQREALSGLYRENTPYLSQSNREQLREITDRAIRYIEELDASRERAMILQEELSSRLSEQMEKRMYLLSIVAVIFLPLSFVTGLLGINVGGIPGSSYENGFILVCAILLIIFVVSMWLLHKNKWI